MQYNVYKGAVAYFPSSIGKPPEVTPPEQGGYIEYPEKVNGIKVRGRSPSFFDFYSHAQLFWNSLTEAEQQQLVDASRFELGKSQSMEVRKRMIDVLNHVDNGLARRVAVGIGLEPPEKLYENHNKTSVGLSIEKYPKPDNIRTRTVAILTAPGTNTHEAQAMYDYLKQEGAYPEYIGIHLGKQDGLNITNTYLTASSVLYDALYVPGGKEGIGRLTKPSSLFPYEEPKVWLLDAWRHGKPISASGEGIKLLKASDVKIPKVKENEVTEAQGVIVGPPGDDLNQKYRSALVQQRFWYRLPMDPPI